MLKNKDTQALAALKRVEEQPNVVLLDWRHFGPRALFK
jgi:hypothetical protein